MRKPASILAVVGVLCATAVSGAHAAAGRTHALNPIQLSVIAPDPSSIGDRVSLDVTFRGSTVETVELYLDGALVAKRQLATNDTHGVITFSLDTIYLTEGAHDLQVRAFGSDGKSAVAGARLRIPGADLSAPVRIAYPQNGIQVYGIVPIRASVDRDLQRQKPYVTFFVDKELKVLRNYPPYEYIWDTTKIANGWHMVEAWTQTPEMLNPYKAKPVHVNVNNAGGETKKQTVVEDLRPQVGPPTRSITMQTETGPEGAGPAPAKSSLAPRSVAGLMSDSEPSGLGYGTRSMPAAKHGEIEGGAAKLPAIAPRLMGTAVPLPRTRMVSAVVVPAPKAVLPSLGSAPAIAKVRAGETLSSVAKRTGVSAAEIARLNNIDAKAPVKSGASLIVPQFGAFDVAFDGIPVAFDVQPRIERGVKLAPFRQIFQHTGGRLYWFGGKAQTVRAISDRREVEMKIGKSDALVNNQTMTMERQPFLESGRTIVPISFIRDALDVKLDYKADTGRMMIRSK